MVGIRRAIALLFLSFYVTYFGLTAALNPDFFACFFGLTMVYGIAFVGLSAEWFWARWFAIGVGNFGSLILLVLFQAETVDPIIVFVGGTHLAIWLMLLGEGMAAKYEYSEATAERWNLQEESLILMRRAIKSAGTTLPFLILWALGPREEAPEMLALGLGVAGLIGLLRGRTWGVFALGGAGALALAAGLGAFGPPGIGVLLLTPSGSTAIAGTIAGLLAGGLLIVPLIYARPMLRFLRAR
ncbi:MAG: hypothetical protein AAF799_08725 [Myxococcota bacterium]